MAGRIKGYRFCHRFKKQYKTLPHEIREAFKEKLVLVKKIQGVENRWEGSITMKYRFTFEFDQDTVVFRAIGTHDILLRNST
jgi:mRNA-degrading endonuclease RelE of RelBE toxin-antitoxin system